MQVLLSTTISKRRIAACAAWHPLNCPYACVIVIITNTRRCLEDLATTTRYVSWSLHTRSSRSLRSVVGKVGWG